MNKCIILLIIAVILSIVLFFHLKTNTIEKFEEEYRSNTDLFNEAHNKVLKTTLKDCISEVQNDFGFSDVFTKAYDNYYEIKSKEYLGYKLDSKKDPETLNKKELEIALKVLSETPACNDLINKYGVGQYIPKDDDDLTLINKSHQHTHGGTTHIHNHDGTVTVVGEEDEEDILDSIDQEDIDLTPLSEEIIPQEEDIDIIEEELLQEAAKQLMPEDLGTTEEEKSILKEQSLEKALQEAAGTVESEVDVHDEETVIKTTADITAENTEKTQNYIADIGNSLQGILQRLGVLENKHKIQNRGTDKNKKIHKNLNRNINIHNKIIKNYEKSTSNELANNNAKLLSNVNAESYELLPENNFSYKPETNFDHKQPSKKILSAYGWSYMPPQFWSVPQKRPPSCIPSKKNTDKVLPIYDKATPIDALDWTQVGSILPKFQYDEVHNPNYYHPGWISQDNIKYPFSSGQTSNEYYNLNQATSTKK